MSDCWHWNGQIAVEQNVVFWEELKKDNSNKFILQTEEFGKFRVIHHYRNPME